MSHRTFLLACVVTVTLAANHAAAHEFWLAPSRYAGGPGVPVTIRALAGTGFRGEEKPWDPGHSVRFVARAGRSIDMTRATSPGDFTWARFAPSDAGGAMLAFESGFTPIELPAAQFEKYLVDEGLTGPLAARRRAHVAGPGRERYRRCAKTWLAGEAAERATTPLGLPLEIVPASAPGNDTTLRIQVLANGKPQAGTLVKAWCATSGTDAASRDSIGVAWSGRTDARGEISVPVAQPGEWLLSTVQMVPCPDRSESEWESTWASLTIWRQAVNP
jgi:uncharacterized GH25 family protein